jgi:hypothetical protein
MEVAVDVNAAATISVLAANSGTLIAGERMIAVADTSTPDAIVTAMVRVLVSAA